MSNVEQRATSIIRALVAMKLHKAGILAEPVHELMRGDD